MDHGGQISQLFPSWAAADGFVFVLAMCMYARFRRLFQEKRHQNDVSSSKGSPAEFRTAWINSITNASFRTQIVTQRMAKPTALHCSKTEEARKSECSLSLSVMATYGLLCSCMVAWKTVHLSYTRRVKI